MMFWTPSRWGNALGIPGGILGLVVVTGIYADACTRDVSMLYPSWDHKFGSDLEVFENGRHSAAICPLLVCQHENERVAAE